MKYNVALTRLPDMPEGYVKHMIEQAQRELIKALLDQVRCGQWYTFRMDEETMRDPERGEYKTIYSFRLAECQTEHVRIPTLEEVMFVPQPSLWGRFKNCVRYLRNGR